jgi:hypothetical protein
VSLITKTKLRLSGDGAVVLGKGHSEMHVGVEGGRDGALLDGEGDIAVRAAQAASAGANELKRDAKPWQNWA